MGGAAEQIGEYFREKQKLKHELVLAKLRGKAELVKAQYQARAQAMQNEHNWEMAQIRNSGVKDEIVLAIIGAPYVGAFVPGVQDYILVGFQYLAQMPAWAVGLTVAIFLAIYGIRHRGASKIRAPGLRKEDVSGSSDK